ncbi:MAG: NUDIX hydrolase [Lysobacter sp.]|nr:NUDIX hydrolase [Lysobacter sp.]
MNTTDALLRLRRGFDDYAGRWSDEIAVSAAFCALLEEASPPAAADPFVRARLAGHFTASAWLVDRSGNRLLMTHHRKLDRWLQLGGHADGDRDLAAVALKEAEEESGLTDLVVEPTIFDLDRHWIPERGDVPGHWHYDVRYVVRATGSEAFAVGDESHDLAWREIAGLLDDASIDPSIARMARKWASRCASSMLACDGD